MARKKGMSRVDMIIDTLRANPDRVFTARELAQEFLNRYPEELADKINRARAKNNEHGLISQLAAEIGGDRTDKAKRDCKHIVTEDFPKPRRFYWTENPPQENEDDYEDDELVESSVIQEESEDKRQTRLLEADLYPLLMEYLNGEFGLHCKRIDEKRSRNSHGAGGNHWLHPDIVALETVDKEWSDEVKNCARHGNDSVIRLWSFEVKRSLSRSNVRQCFFQTVSNSSWASYGYLVTAALGNNDKLIPELQMLSQLHGIGVIVLNPESLFDSQILIHAKERKNIDWQTASRICEENDDFREYIEHVSIYSQTGVVPRAFWQK